MTNDKEFRYRAELDWVEVEIETKENVAAWLISRQFERVYVKALNQVTYLTATRFKFRLQNIDSWVDLDAIMTKLNIIHPMIGRPLITGMEVSFDAYHVNNDAEALKEKTAEFYWLAQSTVSENHRVAGNSYAESTTSHRQNIKAIHSGKSIYIGSQKDDAISQRIYYKSTDNKNTLPVEQHRARYEVTFQGLVVPVLTIEEAKAFKFTDLASYFKFRKLKPSENALDKLIADQMGQVGDWYKNRPVGSRIRIHNPATLANTTLNQIAYDKLRDLTKRMQSSVVKPNLRKLRVFPLEMSRRTGENPAAS